VGVVLGLVLFGLLEPAEAVRAGAGVGTLVVLLHVGAGLGAPEVGRAQGAWLLAGAFGLIATQIGYSLGAVAEGAFHVVALVALGVTAVVVARRGVMAPLRWSFARSLVPSVPMRHGEQPPSQGAVVSEVPVAQPDEPPPGAPPPEAVGS
jgi:hypothetical protein